MISPSQCRGARALLGITQQRLADLAGISKRTVIEFEGAVRVPLLSTSRNLQWALESAGIEFLSGQGGGSGVRFRDVETEQALQPRGTSRRASAGSEAPAAPAGPTARSQFYDAKELTLRDFERFASDEQRQALELYRAEAVEVPEEVARRATMVMVDGGRLLMDWQGKGIQLFPEDANLKGVPLAELPDSNYGRWAEGRVLRACQAGVPIFELCHSVVEVDGKRTVWRYYSLRLPRPDGRALTVTNRA